eukprot:TRINITY_DN17642_c0_g1_i3.p1 TRINITY_DN17642_c0_g1~~TRINITY_DN17642_c0_g1_i3.p1  ORF type:complete len:126 (-),score=13.02 TRINITY_DN17642_c0_g1_i3:157-534(-)
MNQERRKHSNTAHRARKSFKPTHNLYTTAAKPSDQFKTLQRKPHTEPSNPRQRLARTPALDKYSKRKELFRLTAVHDGYSSPLCKEAVMAKLSYSRLGSKSRREVRGSRREKREELDLWWTIEFG